MEENIAWTENYPNILILFQIHTIISYTAMNHNNPLINVYSSTTISHSIF